MNTKTPIFSRKEHLPSWLFSLNRVWIGILFIVLLGTLSLEHSTTQAGNSISIDGLYRCTNSMRAEHQQKNLYLSEQLNRAAFHKLVDMEEYGYWAHQNPSTGTMGWEFIDQSGYYYQIAGENLAIGYTTNEKVCEAWKESPTHFANMISPDFLEVGFAFEEVELENNKAGVLVVQLFATKAGFEKNYRKPPACNTRINSSLYVVSPLCDITRQEEKSIVLYNPRHQKVEITIDGEEETYQTTLNGKHVTYHFEKPFSLGSHEISIWKILKNKGLKPKKAQIRFIVAAPENTQIGQEPLNEHLSASLLDAKSSRVLGIILFTSLLTGIGFYLVEKRKKPL